MYNPYECNDDEIVGRRSPTPYELKFGYGATHYRTFDRELWLKPDGTYKKWIKSYDDNLRYHR